MHRYVKFTSKLIILESTMKDLPLINILNKYPYSII